MISAVFPIHKKYSDLIFSGYKNFEFRHVRTKLEPGSRVYIYETKKERGLGKVVGYFVCGEIKQIPRHKIGTYTMLPFYVDKFGTDEEKETVRQIMRIDFDDHDNSLALIYLFCERELIDEMVETRKPIDTLRFWNYKDLNKRMKEKDKASNLQSECDKWLTKIGFYNADYGGKSDWDYMIEIASCKKFDNPVAISEFHKTNGEKLEKAPQNFCYVLENGCEDI